MTRSRAEEECGTLGEAYDEGYEQGREDAINKFVTNAITEFQKIDKEHGYPTLSDISVILCGVAEQMKEQKNVQM